MDEEKLKKVVNLLPIGTVVNVKGETRSFMIIGFLAEPAGDETKHIYDYMAILYPEGVLSFKEIYMFDQERINQICHMGYSSEQDQEFKQYLVKRIEEIDHIKIK